MMLYCLWNMWVKHVQASLPSLLRLLLWPLSHSFYLTATTDRLLLSQNSKTVTLTLSCQLFMSKCPALSRVPSPLTALSGVSVSERPLYSIQPSTLWLIKFCLYFRDAFTYAISHKRLFFIVILPKATADLRHGLKLSSKNFLNWYSHLF